jgi:hypothetical protein
MSNESWIIPIPKDKSIQIAEIAKQSNGDVFMLDKSILEGIPDFPKEFIDNKIDSVSFSTSACDNGNITVCLGVIRKDRNEFDLDPIGMLFLDISSPTISAGYIKHGGWHDNRTITKKEAEDFFREINSKSNLKLNIAPAQCEAMHKRINSFLFSKQQQCKSTRSRFIK